MEYYYVVYYTYRSLQFSLSQRCIPVAAAVAERVKMNSKLVWWIDDSGGMRRRNHYLYLFVVPPFMVSLDFFENAENLTVTPTTDIRRQTTSITLGLQVYSR